MNLNINNFDLVLFKGGFISNIIILIQRLFYKTPKYGKWSHVGMILTSDFLDLLNISYPKNEKYFVLESTLSGILNDNVKDINNKIKFGVQIRSFNKLLQVYDYKKNKIAILKLNKKIELNDDQINKFKLFYNKHKNSKYDYTLYIFLKALFNCPNCINIRIKNNNLFFCSELITEIYIIMNILDDNIDPETITPFELLKFNIYKEFLKLENNIVYL